MTDDGAPNASDTETIAVTVGGVAVDFDADGRADLLWHNPSTGQLYAWLMNGRAQASATFLTPGSVGTAWQVRGIADLDGDGRSDVLFHNQATGELYAWFMDGVTRRSAAYLTPAAVNPALWQVQGLTDFDGDGTADILWRHQGTGQLYVWLMDGTRQISGVFLTPSAVPDAAWQVAGLADFDGDGKTDIAFGTTIYLGNGDGTFSTTFAFGMATTDALAHFAVGDFNGDNAVDDILTQFMWTMQQFGLEARVLVGAEPISVIRMDALPAPEAVRTDWPQPVGVGAVRRREARLDHGPHRAVTIRRHHGPLASRPRCHDTTCTATRRTCPRRCRRIRGMTHRSRGYRRRRRCGARQAGRPRPRRTGPRCTRR